MIITFKKISWGVVHTTNKTLFDVFNKNLANPNERLSF
jgi:hypothetical protein